MKAWMYKGIENIELQEIELPKCGPNDVIIKNIYAGICGSDIAAYKHGGDSVYIFKDSEFGHEMVSEIVEVGSEVKDLAVGQLVYPYPIFAKGNPRRSATVGGFSEYVYLPNCELGKSVFLVDDAISNKVAAMIEPFTVGAHAAKVGNPQEGQNAVVFGAGMIGISAAIALKEMGIDKIMVCDISDYRLQKAQSLGFAVCNTMKETIEEKAKEEFGESISPFGNALDIDIFIDATGVQVVPETFQKIAKFGATLIVVGVHHQPRELNLMQLTYKEHTIKGSAGYDMDDVQFVMNVMKEQNDRLETIISHEFSHEQLVEAILTSANANESMKVLIKYE